ncbi:MAG: hypothetical protein RL071_3626 [Pseudomonadota bacterium]
MRLSALLVLPTLLLAASAAAHVNNPHNTQLQTGMNDCAVYDKHMGPGACLRDCEKINRTPGWGCQFNPDTGKAFVRLGLPFVRGLVDLDGRFGLDPLRVPAGPGVSTGVRVYDGGAVTWVGADVAIDIELYSAEGELVAHYEGVDAVELELIPGDFLFFSAAGDTTVELIPR